MLRFLISYNFTNSARSFCQDLFQPHRTIKTDRSRRKRSGVLIQLFRNLPTCSISTWSGAYILFSVNISSRAIMGPPFAQPVHKSSKFYYAGLPLSYFGHCRATDKYGVSVTFFSMGRLSFRQIHQYTPPPEAFLPPLPALIFFATASLHLPPKGRNKFSPFMGVRPVLNNLTAMANSMIPMSIFSINNISGQMDRLNQTGIPS